MCAHFYRFGLFMSLHIYIYFIISPYYLLSIRNSSQAQEFGFVQEAFDHK